MDFNGKILTGARAKVLFDEEEVGFLTNWSIREEVRHDPFEPIGMIEVNEQVPVAYTVSGGAATARIIGTPATKVKLFPNWRNLRAGGTNLTLQLLDDVTGTVCKVVRGVKMSGLDMTVEGRSMVGEQVTWVGTTADDEFTGIKK